MFVDRNLDIFNLAKFGEGVFKLIFSYFPLQLTNVDHASFIFLFFTFVFLFFALLTGRFVAI